MVMATTMIMLTIFVLTVGLIMIGMRRRNRMKEEIMTTILSPDYHDHHPES